MPVISKRFADELNDKEMRDAYLDEKTRGRLALQIKENRIVREWSQAEMGERTGKPQSNIARLEDRDIARYTLTTLLEIAVAFDCGLIVEFVPYEDFLLRTSDFTPAKLRVPAFNRAALAPLYQATISGGAATHAFINKTSVNQSTFAAFGDFTSVALTSWAQPSHSATNVGPSVASKGLTTSVGEQSASVPPDLFGQIGTAEAGGSRHV